MLEDISELDSQSKSYVRLKMEVVSFTCPIWTTSSHSSSPNSFFLLFTIL